MRAYSIGFLALLISCLLLTGFKNCHGGRIFSLKMHHRFTDAFKNRNHLDGKISPAGDWPSKGSYEYYVELARHDRLRHGRRLSEAEPLVAFSEGNLTFRMNSLGFLHYATVKLGTPGMKFLVALDTGSDLFWVPCECSKCASTEGTTYASEFELSIYNPEISSTSRRVGCNDNICTNTMSDNCQDTPSSCPYSVSYVSDETSSSGVLIEDILHLTTEGSQQEPTEAYIAFGCGQVQTGSFLNIAAPNGLFGLGMEKTSVPSILAEEGYIADSFSMCFGSDGVGRINFGDKGSSDQDETRFNPNPSNPSYNISIAQIRVGATMVDADVTALFDSGTSFTYLSGPIYTRVVDSFHSQVRDARHPPDSRIPFEYCYDMSSDANSSSVPSFSLVMNGGKQFAIHDPLAIISTPNEFIYCLAIIKSAGINIIGQNFMTGYRVVFDREKFVLGWKKFNCKISTHILHKDVPMTYCDACMTYCDAFAGYEMDDMDSFSTAGNNKTILGTATDVAAGLDENKGDVRSSASLPVTGRFCCFRYFFLVWVLLL